MAKDHKGLTRVGDLLPALVNPELKALTSGLVKAGDTNFLRGMALTPAQERLLQAAETIALSPAGDIVFQHAVFCQIALPRKKTSDLRYEHTVGPASILIKAGELRQGEQWVQQPLPCGVKARLVLLYAVSEALRHRSPTVSLGRTASEFMERLKITRQGSEYRSFNAQLKALSAADVKLGVMFDGGISRTKAIPTFDHIDLLSRNPNQTTLWAKEIEFTPQFFESILEHSVPLREEAVIALRGSAVALDVYSWLAHRLFRIKGGGLTLRWEVLRQQFGQEYASLDNFKTKFRLALRQVLAVYPDARVEEASGGIHLCQSAPPVPRVTVAVPELPKAR